MPADPMELVTGDAQPVGNAQHRIAAIVLREKARTMTSIRVQPYDLKTSFTASGGTASDGNWTLEDISRAHKYRWAATGPNYSTINLYPDGTTNGLTATRQAATFLLRLLQVRSAIFGIYLMPGPRASIRTATGLLNGEPQNCVLIAIAPGSSTFSGGRNWGESEYCVDSKTGLLSQYSPAPGLFVRYDYSSGIKFHNTFIPTAFSIFENGRVVAQARTISATEPPAATDSMFDTAGLTALGAGPAMNRWGNMRMMIPAPGQRVFGANTSPAVQVVSLHGDVSGNGQLSEVEILASTAPSLNQAAVDHATSTAQRSAPLQPSGTAQSSEMFLTLEFITSGQ